MYNSLTKRQTHSRERLCYKSVEEQCGAGVFPAETQPGPHRPRRRNCGFTLIELMIVITIIGILIGVAVPIYSMHLRRANEAALKQDLHTLRQAIDQYTQDKNRAPQSLQDVVSAGYIGRIPVDPMTGSADTWQVVNEDVLVALDQTQPGISDVHSGSEAVGSDGAAFSSW